MQHHWIRYLSAVAFALVMAACSSSGKKEQHPEPLPGSEQPGVTAPAQSDSEIGRSVDASGNPINPQTGVALTRVFYFDYDKASLQPESLAILEQHAAFLRNNPERRVTIDGFTDERGTREYNLALGDRRANAVRDYLVSRGIGTDRLRTVSYGEERPKYDNAREETRRLNRRGVGL